MSERLTVYFIGHGNPMNALGDTPQAGFLKSWGQSLPKLRAIVVVSAHGARAWRRSHRRRRPRPCTTSSAALN